MRTVRALFRIPAFARLMFAYTLNELAWSVGTLALAVLVYKRTGSALGSAGFFLCSQVAPALVAPAVVARLERLAPRRLLPALYWLEAILFGALAWMTARFELAPVLVLVVADGLVALTARSLTGALRADILKPVELLHEGNAATNTAFSICFMVGPLIGGAVTAAGGTVTALIATAGLFAVMGASLASDAIPGAGAHAATARGRLRGALRYVRRDRALSALFTLQTAGFVLFTISTPIEVVYAEDTLHAGAEGYGALLAAWGGGAVLGSLAYALWSRRSARALLAGTSFVVGVGFAILAVAPNIAIALVGGAVAGIANGLGAGAFRTEIQNRTQDTWMALVTTLLQSIGQLAPGLGILLGGVIASLASSRAAFATAGIGSLAFGFVTIVALRPARLELGHRADSGVPAPEPGPDDAPVPPRVRVSARP